MSRDPLVDAFAALVERAAASPLVVSPERTVTVGELDAAAEAAGRGLAASPALSPNSLVGLLARNGPGFLASFLALRRAGLAVLLLDPLAPESENRRIARALDAAALLHCRTGWPVDEADWHLTLLDSSEPVTLPGIAAVKLTSGSTGLPRGIATPAAALLADEAALAASMGIRTDDRLLAAIPLSHSYGLSSLALPALVRGTVLAMPERAGLLEPFAVAESERATVFPTTPAYLEGVLRLSHPPALPASLRLVITAGAPLRPATARRFRETFGQPVHVFYGASECGGICYDRRGDAGERGTVGTPVDGVRITLLPAENGCGEGTVAIESPAVAAGYLPEPGPRLAGGRFVASDRGAWVEESGEPELMLRGRLDDLINVRGKKVDPREVEQVLCQLPGVTEAAVLGVTVLGREDEIVRAVVACLPGALTSEQVATWCREHLATHKVPRSIVLVETLPRTSRGKLDRSALQSLAGHA